MSADTPNPQVSMNWGVQPFMTLRDYFAAKAMTLSFGPIGSTCSKEDMAAACYQMADAMLAARGGEK